MRSWRRQWCGDRRGCDGFDDEAADGDLNGGAFLLDGLGKCREAFGGTWFDLRCDGDGLRRGLWRERAFGFDRLAFCARFFANGPDGLRFERREGCDGRWGFDAWTQRCGLLGDGVGLVESFTRGQRDTTWEAFVEWEVGVVRDGRFESWLASRAGCWGQMLQRREFFERLVAMRDRRRRLTLGGGWAGALLHMQRRLSGYGAGRGTDCWETICSCSMTRRLPVLGVARAAMFGADSKIEGMRGRTVDFVPDTRAARCER